MNDMSTPDLSVSVGINQARLAKELAALEKRATDAVKGIEKKTQIKIGTKSAEESAKVFERELDRLRTKFDPLYANSRRYEQQLEELNQAHRVGAINAKQYEHALEAMNQEFVQSTTVQRGWASAAGGAGRVSAQAGLQVQDFFVQVAAGTSAVQAAAQQAPQLLGLFGAWGAWAGAAVASGLPAVAMIAKMAGETKSLADITDDLTSATDAQSVAFEAAQAPMEQLAAKYGHMADEMQRALGLQAQLTAAQGQAALLSATQAGAAMFGSGLSAQPQQRLFGQSEEEFAAWQEAKLRELMAATGATREEAERLQRALRLLETSNGPEAAVRDAQRLQDLLVQIAGGIPQAQAKFGAEMSFLSSVIDQAGRQIETGLSEADRRAVELSESYDQRTRALAALTKDRADAEKLLADARAKSDQEAVARAERVISAIDDEIEQTRSVKSRVDDAREAMLRMRDIADRAALNPKFEADFANLQAQIDRAVASGANLSELDLSAIEAAIRRMAGWAADMAGSFDQSIDGMSQSMGRGREEYARSRMAGNWMAQADAMASSRELIKAKEGYRSTAYWDVNHWRAGYGSDTGTRADGSIYAIQEGMTISAEDARRDLDRRIGSYFDAIIAQIGADRFSGLGANQKASLASLLHNYGAGEFTAGGDLGSVLSALLASEQQAVADAIAARGSDNGGINRSRRLEEAEAFGGASASSQADLTARQKALDEEIKAREDLTKAHDAFSESLLRGIANAEFERSIIGKSKEDQARLRAEYLLTEQAKRSGLDLNSQLAGSEMTLADAIKAKAKADAEAALSAETRRAAEERSAQALAKVAQAQNQFRTGLVGSMVAGRGFDGMLQNLASTLANHYLDQLFFGAIVSGKSSGGILSGLYNGIGRLASFEGGGDTPSGPRAGGLDGKGGFLALLHPDETVTDHLRGKTMVPNLVASPTRVAAAAAAQARPSRIEIAPSPYFDVRVAGVSNSISMSHQRRAARDMPGALRDAQARGIK